MDQWISVLQYKYGGYHEATINLKDVVGWGLTNQDDTDPQEIELYFNDRTMIIKMLPSMFRPIFTRYLKKQAQHERI
jgi:hypothetical protein